MDTLFIVIVIAIIVALAFDVINGFHDAANSIATVVSTRVLSPRFAVLWAAFFNFTAIFVFHELKVANTISKIININSSDQAFVYVVLAGLLGAIFWDIITWWWGLPTSSSHALIGGLAGSGLAYKGFEVINWPIIYKTVAFIPLAPLIGLAMAFVIMIAVYWIFKKWTPYTIDVLFRKGQLVSAALYSLGHGANDAQKTMGVILAILTAYNSTYWSKHQLSLDFSMDNIESLAIIFSCQIAIAVGTALGGWKIVKTMGMKLTKLKPVHGFCAETGGALTTYLATYLGIPVSTTHTIAGSIVGVGMTTSMAGIKWKIATRIVMSWIVTIPAAALVAAICFWLISLFHNGF